MTNYHRPGGAVGITVRFLLALACACGWLVPAAGAAADAEAISKQAIHYESGGLKIGALLSKPTGAGPFPLVVVNHGGFEPARSAAPFIDLFAKQGYVVVAPDYRGCGDSEGRRELAKGEVDDVLAAVRYGQGLPYVDGERVVLWGFSHGAAVSLLAASREPRVKAVVAVQGPVEMAECYQQWVKNKDKPGVRPLAGLHLIVGGTPEQVPDAWRSRSALYVAATIRCPVLLIYGDQDDAVPADQGPRMKAALDAAGNAAAKLLLVHGANHGLGKQGWAEVMKPMVNFLNKQVGVPQLP